MYLYRATCVLVGALGRTGSVKDFHLFGLHCTAGLLIWKAFLHLSASPLLNRSQTEPNQNLPKSDKKHTRTHCSTLEDLQKISTRASNTLNHPPSPPHVHSPTWRPSGLQASPKRHPSAFSWKKRQGLHVPFTSGRLGNPCSLSSRSFGAKKKAVNSWGQRLAGLAGLKSVWVVSSNVLDPISYPDRPTFFQRKPQRAAKRKVYISIMCQTWAPCAFTISQLLLHYN